MKDIETKLKELPAQPGVYFHKDINGKIIYVGKAAILKNRVRQYFQNSRLRDAKTDLLVNDIADIEWITTDSEMDALFLEAELIKRYKPKYNIALRDDKSDLYVRIDFKSDHPTLSYTRRPLDDKAEYFGPYQNGFEVKRALKYLRRIFPYDLKKPIQKRVTLDYHIGLSPGLEEDKTSLLEYRNNLKKLKMYLKGSRTQLVNEIEREMKQAAKNQNFEAAARLRNQMTSLKKLNMQVVFSDKEFMDISKDQALVGLQDLLKLKNIPARIEGYDISHMQGTDTVASMVVFTKGIPNKREYRKFKMRIPGNDDFAHMNEVITRRFSGRNLERWPKPDLLLIDGGKGQLGAALNALDSYNIKIPAIGLAKKQEIIITKQYDEYTEILLDPDSNTIKLLQRIRDESHRFAVSYHSTLKIKRQTASRLEDVPGIGPKTRKKLLLRFGSLRTISKSSEGELQKVIGEKKGTMLYNLIKEEKKI